MFGDKSVYAQLLFFNSIGFSPYDLLCLLCSLAAPKKIKEVSLFKNWWTDWTAQIYLVLTGTKWISLRICLLPFKNSQQNVVWPAPRATRESQICFSEHRVFDVLKSHQFKNSCFKLKILKRNGAIRRQNINRVSNHQPRYKNRVCTPAHSRNHSKS